MLYLISLGIGDGISVKGMDTARTCDVLYMETYTAPTPIKRKLEILLSQKITVLERSGVEEQSGKLIEEARTTDVGLLIGGDALFATTHLSLILECKHKNVEYQIIPGSSIITAVGETGLSLYKFGEIVTVPRWKPGYQPAEFVDTIFKNHEQGLHSLILLEPGMNPQEGMEILLKIKPSLKDQQFIVFTQAGSPEQHIRLLAAKKVAGKAPAVLILPGRLNAFEEEFLKTL